MKRIIGPVCLCGAMAAFVSAAIHKPASPLPAIPEPTIAAVLGDASAAIASTTPAATAQDQLSDLSESSDVVSLPSAASAPPAMPPAHAGESGAVSYTSPVQSVAEQMLAASNRYVARSLSPELTAAAQSYADYLAATHQQGHYANGSPEQRARAAGFTGTLLTPGRRGADGWTSYGVGEVLCFGGRNISDAFNSWLASRGHRAALYEPTYTLCGFGQRGTVWVGLFGSSKSSASAPAATALPAARAAVSYPQPRACPSGACGQSFIVPQQYQRRRLFGR